MKKLLKYISIILFISFISCQNGNKTKESSDDLKDVKIEKSISRNLKSKYKIYSIGHADMFSKTETDTTCIIGKNKYTAVKKGYVLFNNDTIQLESELYLEKTFITENEKNIYIFYTNEDFDSGGSQALSVDKKTLKTNWKHSIGGFNLSKPIIDNDIVYIASLDHLSKLSLKTGEFYWRLDSLYQKYKINYVEKTIFKNNLNLYIYIKNNILQRNLTHCM